jgi:2-polyprenyl-6-methoxyphenol hydroxylase-like FAD-dependent oxidoreductase
VQTARIRHHVTCRILSAGAHGARREKKAMNDRNVDCVIVGARCAGAPLAIWLARKGLRVVMVDADKVGSDLKMSTHFIQSRGIQLLDELGAGDGVRALAPPVCSIRAQIDNVFVDVPLPKDRPGRGPRRDQLDALLQARAQEAGAELFSETRVIGLLRSGERVVGVETERGGKRQTVRARWVVGADGRSSTVAQLTGAKEYLSMENERAFFWSYWRKPEGWEREHGAKFYAVYEGAAARSIFETSGDRLVVAAAPPTAEGMAWKTTFPGRYEAYMRESPVLGPMLAPSQPLEPVRALLKMRYFFREPVGPGYALLGDAGHTKDPLPAGGMTDALRDARWLAEAISEDTDEAMRLYWRRRDAAAMPLYFNACDSAALDYANDLNRLFYARIAAEPDLLGRLARVLDRDLSPMEIVGSGRVMGWVLKETLRGHFGALRAFFAAGTRGARAQRAVMQSQRDLAALLAKNGTPIRKAERPALAGPF